MIGVSDIMIDKVRSSLLQAAAYPDGIIPVSEMSNHYCSLEKLKDEVSYRKLFTVEVDGRDVFVYFKP